MNKEKILHCKAIMMLEPKVYPEAYEEALKMCMDYIETHKKEVEFHVTLRGDLPEEWVTAFNIFAKAAKEQGLVK